MKSFKRISIVFSVVCMLGLSGMMVNATSFPDMLYKVKYLSSTYTSYDNTTTQSTYTVTVNTRPETTSAVVKVSINKNYPATVSGAVASRNFPGSMTVYGLTFSLPAGKRYYAYISTEYNDYVQGVLTATY